MAEARFRRATIGDVARVAGVGKVTASYVLSGRSKSARISDETAKKVERVAEELNYRPNALARMLVRQRSDAIAVVFQRGYFFTSWSSFTAEVMRGVATASVDLGFDLLLHTKQVSEEDEASVLADGRVDGVLALRDANDPIFEKLREHHLPCVQFFCRSKNENDVFVDADNVHGAKVAVEHLLSLGHRRIAYIGGPDLSTASEDRLKGFQKAMSAADLPASPEFISQIPSASSDTSILYNLMRRSDRPTALFVWSDDVALTCLSVLSDMGFRLPADVSVVGFDSLEVCNRSVPPLTSVKQPVSEMATKAVQLLVEWINGQPPKDRQIYFPTELEMRGSTAPVST